MSFFRRTCSVLRAVAVYIGPALFLAAGLFVMTFYPERVAAMNLTGNGSAFVASGDTYDFVYGRLSQGGEAVADGSMVNVTGGSISMDLYGGYALSRNGSAEAMNNSVLVSGGPVVFNDNIYGGYARSSVSSAWADGNHVTLAGSLRLGPWVQVFGGYARMTGGAGTVEALSNQVDIGGSATLNFVVGGEAYAESSVQASSLAAGNVVNLESGVVTLLYGGYAIAGKTAVASGNAVNISGGTFREVVGGEVHSYTGSAVAEGNTVTVTGGTGTGNVFGASVQGDTGTASATGNTVSLFNTSVSGSVGGGFAPDSSVAATVSHNTVIVGKGASVDGDAVGGAVTGTTPGSSADFNIVAVTDGGHVDGDVMGGMVEAENASVEGNTVLVRNASIGGDVYGGRGGSGSLAGHNNVIIGVGADLSSSVSLYGGYVGGSPVDAAGSGNTLFVDSWQGSVARVAGFENLHFVLPAPGVPVDVPMLTVTNAEAGDFVGSTVTAQLPGIITGGRAYLGETFTLIQDESGAVEQASAGRLVSLLQGYTTYFDGALSNTGTEVQLRLTSTRMNPRIAALAEARAAGAGLLNQGADLAADAGLRHAREAAEPEGAQWHPFTAVYGGYSRYHTGSHADIEGFSGMAGLTGNRVWGDGRMVIGGFFEFGRAHLSTFNGFSSGNVRGRGNSQYAGAGVLARFDVTSGPLSGWYAEGVARAGQAETEWYSADLKDNMNRPADYDLSNPYYGFHAGLGHVFSLGESVEADLYGKYFWTHQDGDGADMNGEGVHFKTLDSRRLRMGIRLDWSPAEGVTPYVGAAWEHEYCGTAHVTAGNFTVPDASLKGDSGLFELGLRVDAENTPFSLDVAAVGSTGERDGIGGTLTLFYRF